MGANSRFAMAVHVLAVLAYKDGDGVSSEFLAASVNTNPVIIRRLLLALQEAELVETRKGAGFGSKLRRPAKAINLADVYRAVEDVEPFALPRRKPSMACPVGKGIRVTLEKVFASAQDALERDLEKTTMAIVLDNIRAATVPSHRAGARPRI